MYCLLVCLAVLAVSFLGTSAAVEGPNRHHLSQFGFSSEHLEMGTQGLRGANVETLAQSNGWGMLSFYDNNKCTGKASLSYVEPFGFCYPTEEDGTWQMNSYQMKKDVNFISKYYSDSMCMMQTSAEKEMLPAKCTKVTVGGYAIAKHYDSLPNPPAGGLVTT
jgi:hypothetical protein